MDSKYKSNIANREYSRLSQMNKGKNYQEMQSTYSEKYVQDNYGKFAESEHQKSYENSGDDYQELENTYRHFGENPKIPQYKYNVPKFPPAKQGGGAGSEMFDCWANGCCCNGEYSNLEVVCTYPIIKGPWTTPTSLILKNGKTVCLSATDCNAISIHVICKSPTQAKEVTITNAFIDNCDAAICANLCNDGSGNATTIGLTSTQMTVSTSQNLTITNPNPNVTYGWKIISGGGVLLHQKGISNTFFAPSTNTNCASNATIGLYSNECKLCHSVNIAINGYAGAPVAAGTQKYGHCYCDGQSPDTSWSCVSESTIFYCDGTESYTSPSASMGCSPAFPQCVETTWCAAHPAGAKVDTRTDELKAAGCCPIALF